MSEPMTASPAGRKAFQAWYLRERNRLRRNIRREADEGEVVSSACDGTTLVEFYIDGNGALQERRTENSPSCPAL